MNWVRAGWRRRHSPSGFTRCSPRRRDSRDRPAEHFKAAIALAINHSGDSDSTGSIAGNILGAYYGEQCLPEDWLAALEGPEVIRGMAEQLVAVTTA